MLFQTLLLAGTASATCLHNLSKFKRAEGEVKVGTFGYTGLISPLNWPSLDPANVACKTGKTQSPIVIDSTVPLATEKPVLDIPEQKIEFENLGTTIEVIVNGTTKFAGNDFRLKQFHFHTPSEHRVDEEYFPIEIHLVHEGVTDPTKLAVIGFFFDLSTGAPNPVIESLQPHLAAIAAPGTKTEVEGIDFASFAEHIQKSDIFQYSGSLTTPPCAEGVTFLIVKEPLAVDVDTFNEIKSIVKFNSRFSQNALGEENLVKVAEVAGTPQQHNPKPKANAEDATPVTKGQTITITELHGKPTQIVGVVVKH